jgi:hypothetical protein
MRYESSAFASGSLITIITLILSAGALGFVIIREKRARIAPTPPDVSA